jgi:hypothetical protein
MFQTHVSIDPSCHANKFVLLWQQTKYYSIFVWSLLGSVGPLFIHHQLICVLMVLLLNALKILHQIPSCHTNDTFGFGPAQNSIAKQN